MNSRDLLAIFLFPSLLLKSNIASAQRLPRNENVPGGIAIVSLDYQERPKVFYNDNPVMVIGQPENWKAVVGISLDASPGIHRLKVRNHNIESIHNFYIEDKEYQTQHLTIKNERQVNPNASDMKRINMEKELIWMAKTAWSEKETVDLDLSIPVEGAYSSQFGLRRFFNDKPRRPHSGLDIVAPAGTPIRAPANGKIISIGHYFFNGKTVFIEHGQGMITMYCHMDNIAVKEGLQIKRGDLIGTVGQTGRVTGAHLHWSVILNRTMVNPLLFLSNNEK